MLPRGLDVTGLDETIASMEGLAQQIKINMIVELQWFGRTTTQEMIFTHEWINRTGRLERSIGYVLNQDIPDNVLRLEVFALAPYASAVEEGITGRSRPYPFFWPIFYKYLPELYERMARAVETAFEDAVNSGRMQVA